MMFSSLTRQLQAEIDRVEAVVITNEKLRALIFDSPANPQPEDKVKADLSAGVINLLGAGTPNRVDWQIYDHCAAFTRLYAAYEQFVNELISSYIRQLPNLYKSYNELPEKLLLHHRTGIAQILIKIGPKGQYREVEEETLITAISSGLRHGAPFSLVPEAFFVDKQNYKFEVLVNILSSLGFENTGTTIINHPRMLEFMKSVRGESSTPQGELESFVKYRNEATHGTVDNVVSVDELRKIGEFVGILGDVLSETVETVVLRRRLAIGQSINVGVVQESYQNGSIVVARMGETQVAVGDELILLGRRACKKVRILQIQVNDVDQDSLRTDNGQEVGLRLSSAAQIAMELHRLVVPEGELQLKLDDAFLEAPEDTDLDLAQIEGGPQQGPDDPDKGEPNS